MTEVVLNMEAPLTFGTKVFSAKLYVVRLGEQRSEVASWNPTFGLRPAPIFRTIRIVARNSV